MSKRKGIILAGGKGSRLYPLTQSLSKQLLPVYNKPMIYYPLSTLMQANINDVLIITQSNFIPLYESLLGDGKALGISIHYLPQDIPSGIAEAFIIGEQFINGNQVALILGDNIFYGSYFEQNLKELVNTNDVNLFSITVKNPEQFGAIQYQNDLPKKIIEKPKSPPSQEVITGLYFYNPDICDVAKSLIKSERGELEITDVNNYYLQNDRAKINKLPRNTLWLDTGTFDNLQQCSQIIYGIEKNTNLMIGCIEEIALKNNWITKDQIKKTIDRTGNNEYSKYLKKLL